MPNKTAFGYCKQQLVRYQNFQEYFSYLECNNLLGKRKQKCCVYGGSKATDVSAFLSSLLYTRHELLVTSNKGERGSTVRRNDHRNVRQSRPGNLLLIYSDRNVTCLKYPTISTIRFKKNWYVSFRRIFFISVYAQKFRRKKAGLHQKYLHYFPTVFCWRHSHI